jgi:hypothetical protein
MFGRLADPYTLLAALCSFAVKRKIDCELSWLRFFPAKLEDDSTAGEVGRCSKLSQSKKISVPAERVDAEKVWRDLSKNNEKGLTFHGSNMANPKVLDGREKEKEKKWVIN